MQKLIDKLKFVEEELFKDEKYYRGPVMGSIVEVRRELEQALQQTPCSTLRELLVQKLNDVQKQSERDMPPHVYDNYVRKMNELEYFLSLIDEFQSVA